MPVLRLPDGPAAVTAVAECFAIGRDVVELTATTHGWREALECVRSERPDRLIGVGTVLDATVARDAVGLGADFLVSPCPAPALRVFAGETGSAHKLFAREHAADADDPLVVCTATRVWMTSAGAISFAQPPRVSRRGGRRPGRW